MSNVGEALTGLVWRIDILFKPRRIANARQAVFLALVVSLTACHKTEKSSVTTFASPELAGEGLLQAGKSGNLDTLLPIFGMDSKDIISSGDPVQDKATVDLFVAGYGAMHRWRKMPDDSEVLLIGPENFAFPIPLKKNAGGQWFFDTAAGKDEILRRRIGRNELAVIDVCGALAEAQAEYFSQHHGDGGTAQYAAKFISDSGKQNGLYWESPDAQPKSPLGPLAAFATNEGYQLKPDSHVPFHGYYFNMLTRQGAHAPGGAKDYLVNGKMIGGFAFVAYPAQYGNSGIMTFILNQDGVLLQKDLGKTTTQTAAAISEFDPADGWIPVEE
jgi:hypothetical protein